MRRRSLIKTNRSFSFNFGNPRILLYLIPVTLALLAIDYFIIEGKRPDFLTPRVPQEKIRALHTVVDSVLSIYNLQGNRIQVHQERTLIKYPRNLSFVFIFSDLVRFIESAGGNIFEYQEDEKTETKKLAIAIDRTVVERLEFKPSDEIVWHTGKVAIIIDDFGNSFNDQILRFLYLPQKITVSVIPGLKFSARVAQEADRIGKEVMVHLPMEPKDERPDPGQFTIMANMKPKEIATRTRLAIQSIPHAKGINNHQGSRATASRAAMEAFLKTVKQEGFYFIDSYTNTESVAFQIARELAVAGGKNMLFLDAEDDEDFIRKQFQVLGEMATRNDKLIAIAHPRPRTLAVFEAELPRLEKRGIHFHYVSELIR